MEDLNTPHKQLNLFCEVECTYCGSSEIKKSNPDLFDGFRDGDTKQLVCRKCRDHHYQLKSQTLPGLYTEMPVLAKPNSNGKSL